MTKTISDIRKVIVFSTILYVSFSCYAVADEDHKTQNKSNGEIRCPSSLNDLAHEADVCTKPLMDMLEGRTKKWAKNENDVAEVCKSFFGIEKCIKNLARHCAKGLQKTMLSTLGSSIGRANKFECQADKYPELFKTLQCVQKNNKAVNALFVNATARLDVINRQMTDLDEKTNSLCCVLPEIDRNLHLALSNKCRAGSEILVRIYKAYIDDIIDLVCRSPKCNGIFDSYTIPRRPSANTGLVQVILTILFSLG